MPTDREIEAATLTQQPQNTEGASMPSAQDIINFISRLRDTTPDVSRDASTPSIPTTTAPTGTLTTLPQRPAKPEVPKGMYVQDTDAKGNPITIVSTTPELKTGEQFTEAIWNHRNNKPTPGFIILPSSSIQANVQKGYQNINEPLQELAPQVGRRAGEFNPISMLAYLAAKGGMIPQSVSDITTKTSGDVGEAVGRFVGEQVNTLPKAGMAVASALAGPYLKIGEPAAGIIPRIPSLISNTLKAGTAGLIGAEGARALGGQQEEITPAQGLEDFAVAALGGTAQTFIGHWLTRFVNSGMQEDVAKQMIDFVKSKNPAIGLQDDAMAIMTSSKTRLNDFIQMGSKALRNSLDEDTETLLDAVKGTLPGTLPAKQSVAYQATLRAGIRKLLRTQNEQLDNIDNPKLFTEGGEKVTAAIGELGDTVRSFIYQRASKPGQPTPPPLKMEPAALRVEAMLQNFQQQTGKYDQGAKVLHYMKQATDENGLDWNKLARLLSPVMGQDPGSQTQGIARILGQGRDLREIPPPPPQVPAGEWTEKLGGLLKQIPGMNMMSNFVSSRKPTPTPWPTQTVPMAPLISFGAQEAGQSAIRSFLEKKE